MLQSTHKILYLASPTQHSRYDNNNLLNAFHKFVDLDSRSLVIVRFDYKESKLSIQSTYLLLSSHIAIKLCTTENKSHKVQSISICQHITPKSMI